MNFKDMLDKLSLLSEATKETEKGRVHKAEPGGYGRKFDTDEEGDEKKEKKPEVKRGRGRPKKGADDSGEVKTYSGAKELQSFMIGNVPKKSKDLEKLPKTKHSLKEWVQEIEEKYVAEAEQITMEPAKQNTQVIKQGTKTLGTVTNPALASTIKTAIGKGEMSLAGDQLGEEALDEKWAGDAKIHATGEFSKKSAEELKSMLAKLKKSGPHPENSPEAKKQRQINFALRAKGGWKKGEGAAQKESMDEAEIPSDQVDMGAGLGAGRSQTTLEGKKDFAAKFQKNIDKSNKDKKETEEKVKAHQDADDAKKDKKKVNESMHKHSAAKLLGKAHALAKEGYNCKYEDMEEARMYHEGFKEGLDECYGMMPIRGVVVGETDAPAATVPGMAQQAMPAMEDDMMEMDKTEWMQHKAKSTPGDTFKAFGQTMKDKDVLEMDAMAFESLDKQLNALLTEGEQVDEGMSVSISKGQQGAPDSVTVSAQDQEAAKLMDFIKHVGLGIFGGDQPSDYGAPKDVSAHSHGDIKVIDDHDGMMAMMKKMAGLEGGDDYKDEEDHDHGHEETCNECGYMESACQCESEMVDEVETPNQMTDEVAEESPQQAGAEEEAMTSHDEEAEAEEDKALAMKSISEDGDEASEEGPESKEGDTDESAEEVSESEQLDEWANQVGKGPGKGTDASFMRDIEFMTKVISGGLNKPKATGQTTIPVIASQGARLGDEDVGAWQKLAGIRK